MRIAVLGTGTVGRALAGRLAELGHEVVVGTRDPAATRARPGPPAGAPWHAADASTGAQRRPPVRLATFAEAAAAADLVVNAASGSAALEVLGSGGAENLAGKVLLDVSNPLDVSHGLPPTLFVTDADSLGERLQRAFPSARVVKTLNTMNADLMVHPELLPEPTTVFVSGDDAAAKTVVTDLLHALGHADVIDLGGIDTARGVEHWLPLWLRLRGALGTAAFNLRIVR